MSKAKTGCIVYMDFFLHFRRQISGIPKIFSGNTASH